MISEAIKALKAGEELKNAETWKNVQATAGAVSAVFGAVIMVLGWVGVHLNVTTEELTYIAGGVAGILGVFNGYTTLATSKRVGTTM
jgi:hypothetical protein